MKKEQIEEAAKAYADKYYAISPDNVAKKMAYSDFIAGANYGAKEGAWIDVRDRLPEMQEGKDYSDNVLAWEDGQLRLMCYAYVPDDNNEFGFVWCQVYGMLDSEGEFDDNYFPTHWQPLPQAPTKWKEETK